MAKAKKTMIETSVQGEGVDPLTMGVRMRTVVEDGVERYEVLPEDAPVVVAEEVVSTEAPVEQKKVAQGRKEK